jgi:hypothetical protein
MMAIFFREVAYVVMQELKANGFQFVKQDRNV